MINEIKTEISKMVIFYDDMILQFRGMISEIKKTDSTIDSDELEKLIQQISFLNNKLTEIIKTSDSTDTEDLLDNVLTAIDKNISDLSTLEKTAMGDKLLGLLDTSREMHCIQWDYFETFEELLQSLSDTQ